MSTALDDLEAEALLDVLAFYADELDPARRPRLDPALLEKWRDVAAAGEYALGRDDLTLGDVRAGRYYRA